VEREHRGSRKGSSLVNIDDERSAERGLASEACAKATALDGKARMVEVDKEVTQEVGKAALRPYTFVHALLLEY
jgi:hypothetical protein